MDDANEGNEEHRVDIILFTYGSLLPRARAMGQGQGEEQGQDQGEAEVHEHVVGGGHEAAEGHGHALGEGQDQGQGHEAGEGQVGGQDLGQGHEVGEGPVGGHGQVEGQGHVEVQDQGQGQGHEAGEGQVGGQDLGQGHEVGEGPVGGHGQVEGQGHVEVQDQGQGQGHEAEEGYVGGQVEGDGVEEGQRQGQGEEEGQGHGAGVGQGQGQGERPCTDLVDRRDEQYFNICVPLYEACLTANWDAANAIFVQNRDYVRYAIDMTYNTPLHIVAYAQETKQTNDFVEKLLRLMTREELQLKNNISNNAFCLAASSGNIEMVTSMVRMNNELVNIPGYDEKLPLFKSALYGKYETLRYLYQLSPNLDNVDFWSYEMKVWLLKTCVDFGFFDIALEIVRNHPQLAKEGSILGVLARKPNAFKRDCTRCCDKDDEDAWRLLKIIWRDNIMRMTTDEVRKILRGPVGKLIRVDPTAGPVYEYPSKILFDATKMGNTLFVIELLRAYPTLTWMRDDDGLTIFHVAAMHRHLGIYNILYEIRKRRHAITSLNDVNGNNMLHLIGMTSKKMREETSRASLLMQRQLLWFKEVEGMLLASYRERKNKKGKTPYEIFSEENKDVISQGVNWMRDCLVVTTLIVTVAFAIAFTVPGGYNQESRIATVPHGHNQEAGIPIFVRKPSFLVFVIADAISLSAASTSLLMFLSLLISRHGQRDFVRSLPRKLMIGLIALFISVAAMMVTFSASFFVLYNNDLKWVPITIAILASIPVLTFSIFQFHLLVDMIGSMFYSRYLFNPRKTMLYKRRLNRFESIVRFFF